MSTPTESRRVAILQSNYIPWKGYFDLIGMVDLFVLYDDAQYTRRDWRNRNKIMTAQGSQWLTIPVAAKGKFTQAIKDTRISDPLWAKKHWHGICHNYRKAPYFDWCAAILEPLYEKAAGEEMLSAVNHLFLTALCRVLGIRTRIAWSMDYDLGEGRSEKLLNVCTAAGAAGYLSGPAAKCYLDVELFRKHNIEVAWMDYGGYPEYEQLYAPFEHGVSIVDLLMNRGPDSPMWMKLKGGRDDGPAR